MLQPQKPYEKRFNSGLQPFYKYKPSKKYVPFIQSKLPVDSPRTFLDFLFRAIGYGAWSTGNITDEMVQQYLEHHRQQSNGETDTFIFD